jgi:hypothetical protein
VVKVIDELLKQEMDRREFLMRVGVSVLGLAGVVTALKTMSGSDGARQSQTAPRYGTGTYGGDQAQRVSTVAGRLRKPQQLG